VATSLLGIGKSALDASKKSLATSSHNIANANTEGFSRQQVNLSTNTPVAEGSYVSGTGVNVRSIKRVHDDLVNKRLHKSMSKFEYDKEREFNLSQVEEVFNEVNSDGSNKVLNRFFNSFRELSNQPENETVRSIVRENARLVVNDFKRQTDSLNTIKKNIDMQLDVSVTDINQTLGSVATLNKEISRLELTGQETGDLRDQRDNSVRKLSEFFEVTTYVGDNGQFTINANGVGTLVTGASILELSSGTVQDPVTGRGKMEIFLKDRPANPVTHKFRFGKIPALLKTREKELAGLEEDINELAYSLAKSTNAIHRQGFKSVPLQTDAQGNVVLTGREGKFTGINFFAEPTTKVRAAEYLKISAEVKEDLSNITTGYSPNSPGDNRIAIGISKLQHAKVLGQETSTMEDHYLKMVGGIGLVTGKSRIDMEQSNGLLAQARAIREKISGVSIDEETANMVKYQQSYAASARVLKVADQMFQTVLGIVNR
jgi:flagellar hook-associated protein 1 FlgK